MSKIMQDLIEKYVFIKKAQFCTAQHNQKYFKIHRKSNPTLYADDSPNTYNQKKIKSKKRGFYAFVLWNSDSRNFGLLSPKFLLFEAEWNVQHKSIKTSFLLLIFFSHIPTKRIIAPIHELYSIFVCLIYLWSVILKTT